MKTSISPQQLAFHFSINTVEDRPIQKDIAQPRLTAKWLIDEDGSLVCQWHSEM